VLVVAPCPGHHSTLLRDTVKSLLQDHKVYITDWTDARMVPAGGRALPPGRLRGLCAGVHPRTSAYGDVHVISVCQPTVPVLAAVSLMASRGEKTPRHDDDDGRADRRPQARPTAVNNLAMNKSYSWFENNVIFRVPRELPGRRPPRLPRLPAAHRLRGHEPRPPRPATTTTSSTW
jgi:poly(3-hydroxybutyrate) depolymerase